MGGGRTGIKKNFMGRAIINMTCSPMMKQTDRCHPDESRPFTTREYAKFNLSLMNGTFQEKMNDIYKQIGNAVPVELAKEVGISII